jgi:DNA polymerase-3 subunit epsilon
MVHGHKIDAASVRDFIVDASIIIAHNANFDRRFPERHWPVFEQKA